MHNGANNKSNQNIVFHFVEMDFSAVTTATDDQLRELGVVRRGDLLSLRGFVKQKLKGETRDEKKRRYWIFLKVSETQEKEG